MCEVLVSCEWLQGQLDKGQGTDITIVDVSWSSSKNCHDDFLKEHIPGASYLNVMESDHNDLFPRNIPTLETFQKNVRDAGISTSSHIIVYSNTDHCGFFMSGRAWWTFQIFGHNKVSVLDAGFQKWKSLGFKTESGPPKHKSGDFVARWTGQYYRKIEDVLDNIPHQSSQVLDSRNAAAHNEAGCIPGATNIPLSTLLDEDRKQMKPLDDIKKLFVEAGIDLSKPVISHCNSGMSSCTLAMAAQLCGNNDVSVYHGGFTEFKNKAAERIHKKK